MKQISGKAYAKINLYLDVRGLRADGYHELETVFQTVELCDLVAASLHRQGGISLRCSLPYLPTDGFFHISFIISHFTSFIYQFSPQLSLHPP